MMLYGAGVEITGGICPLTLLENRFRRAGGQPEYTGSFTGHYLRAVVDPKQWARYEPWLGAAILLLNAAAYLYLFNGGGG